MKMITITHCMEVSVFQALTLLLQHWHRMRSAVICASRVARRVMRCMFERMCQYSAAEASSQVTCWQVHGFLAPGGGGRQPLAEEDEGGKAPSLTIGTSGRRGLTGWEYALSLVLVP